MAGQRESGRGTRQRRRRGQAMAVWLPVLAALVAIGVVAGAFVFFVAGGDGEEEDDAPTADEMARAVVPDLSDLGYEPVQTGRDPLVPPSIGMARALYEAEDETRKVIVQVYLFGDDVRAAAEFGDISAAYASAPIGSLLENPLLAGDPEGQEPANVEATGPELGDTASWYVTRQADANDNIVTTDIYRSGPMVWVVQVLDSAESDHLALREAISGRVLNRYQEQEGEE